MCIVAPNARGDSGHVLGAWNRTVEQWSAGRIDSTREETEGCGVREIALLCRNPRTLRGLRLLSLAATLLATLGGWSQPSADTRSFEYTRSLWRTADGLPEATVQALAETPGGMLWIGTTGGLASFGGAQIHAFSAGILQPLGVHSIFCLTVDRDGTLWAGTEGGGLLHLRGDDVTVFSNAEGLTDGFVRTVFQDKRGTVWVGTDNGLFRMQGERLERVDNHADVPRMAVHSISEDREGNLWAGGSQLISIDPKGAAKVFTLPGVYSKNRVKRILQTSDGTVWVGTVGGLQRLANGRFEPLLPIDTTVRSLLQTSDGILWIGTIGGGVWTLRDGQLAQLHSTDLLPSDTVLTMLQDDNGQIWIGTQAGLVRLTRTPVGLVTLPQGGDPDFETISGDTQGNVWVAAQGLFGIRNGVARPVTFPGLGQLSIRNIFRARDGALWLGTDGSGAYRLGRQCRATPLRAWRTDQQFHSRVSTEPRRCSLDRYGRGGQSRRRERHTEVHGSVRAGLLQHPLPAGRPQRRSLDRNRSRRELLEERRFSKQRRDRRTGAREGLVHPAGPGERALVCHSR